jgi:hypothetical protein
VAHAPGLAALLGAAVLGACDRGSTPGRGERDQAATAPPVLPPPAASLPRDRGEHRGAHRWSTRFGGTDKDAARGVALTPDGDIYLTGYCSGAQEIGGQRVQAEGIDVCLIALDAAGAVRWSRVFGGRGDDIGEAVAVDAQGNVVVVGSFQHELAMGDAALRGQGADDIFACKFDRTGRRLWAKVWGGVDIDAPYAVAVGPRGELAITGIFGDTVRFGEQAHTSAGDADIFLLVLGPDGTPRWSHRFGGAKADYGRAVAVDRRGVIGLLGEFSQAVDFGGGPLTSAGNRDLVLASFAPDGRHHWSKRFGNPFDEVGVGLAVDGSGALTASGAFEQTIDLGGGPLRAAGRADVFVARYDHRGVHLWSRRYGGKDEDIGAGIAADEHGNLFATGWFWFTVDFGTGPLRSAGKKDIYLLKLSPDGEPRWAHRFGGTDNDQGRAVAVGRDGEVVVTGTYRLPLDMGGTPLAHASAEGALVPLGDMFAARFSR